MPYEFSSRLSLTSNEVVVVVSAEDLSYVQNLYVTEKMDLILDITHSMYHSTFLLTMVTGARGDVISTKNTYKEKECEVCGYIAELFWHSKGYN